MPNGFEQRMGEANPFWLASAEEEFGEALDVNVARGTLRPDQAEQLFDMFVNQSESAAEAAMAQMIQANLSGAAVAGGGVPGARALMAPAGAMPVAGIAGMPAMRPAAGRGPRGKVATLVVRQDPTGSVELLSTTPGRPALYQRDVTAAKRLKRVGKKIARLFPKRRSRKKVFKAAGSAIA
jgi:hypothetical protein